jgi:hypothetical protein
MFFFFLQVYLKQQLRDKRNKYTKERKHRTLSKITNNQDIGGEGEDFDTKAVACKYGGVRYWF